LSLPDAGTRALGLLVAGSLPLLAGALSGALAVGLAQTRGLFAPGAVGARAHAEDGARPAVAWATAAIAALVAGLQGASLLRSLVRTAELRTAVSLGAPALRSLGIRLLLVLAAGGAVDLVARRAALSSALAMTRKEREREQREEEGDPALRAEVRRRHRRP
jgi:hypothetical protein